MSKLEKAFEAHKTEDDERYIHFSSRLDHFANYLQSAMNPTVKLKNGEEQEIFLSDAVVMIHDDMKYIKGKVLELDGRTQILEDLNQIKNNWIELKIRLKKMLKPIGKLIVLLSSIFILIYLIIMVAAGKFTIKYAIEFFIKLFT